ncbi:haloacid dehalogenase, type II domain protein [Mycobacterium avium subsp. avium 2285 (R)]|nr:haloacid dehalogenase, type II domain protein [Mycobacterium avium subsp. avium 2285 (R)]
MEQLRGAGVFDGGAGSMPAAVNERLRRAASAVVMNNGPHDPLGTVCTKGVAVRCSGHGHRFPLDRVQRSSAYLR